MKPVQRAATWALLAAPLTEAGRLKVGACVTTRQQYDTSKLPGPPVRWKARQSEAKASPSALP
jgi:hypothetical protein